MTPRAFQDPQGSAVASRRTFLRRSVSAATVAAPAMILAASSSARAATPRAKKPPPPPPKPQTGGLPQLYPNWLMRNFVELRNDERAHVAILQGLLNGDPDNPFLNNSAYMTTQDGVVLNGVRPVPRFINLVQPTVADFAATAAAIENTGVGVYLGIVQALLPSRVGEYFETATEIATIEARHTGFLNSLLNMNIVPNGVPVDSLIDENVALDRISGFFPGGIEALHPPITKFETANPSKANDFIILDFLLVLEYLEAAFYNLNVAKFFGV